MPKKPVHNLDISALYREAQIKRIQDRVATKPDITFARLRADLNLETADLRQLAREAGVELR